MKKKCKYTWLTLLLINLTLERQKRDIAISNDVLTVYQDNLMISYDMVYVVIKYVYISFKT